MKTLIKIFVLFSLLALVSCIHPDFSCSVDSDCDGEKICFNNVCNSDPCIYNYREDICGKGKCIPGGLDDGKDYPYDYGNSYHCECEENAVIPEGSSLCVPTCDGYSEECTEFGLRCNMEKGRCDTICQGEGSCPEGYTCVNSCEKIID